ncbi:MAG: hypothetical protein J0L76_04270 [Rhodobacterales bacterium]|nr:hypothetical protein [Rhodobacterales bacterium]
MPDIEVQELFARLTGQFEDAAALAAEGQRARLTKEIAVTLLREIRAHIDGTTRSLAEIEQRFMT